MSATEKGYTLQYKIVKADGTIIQDWTAYSGPLTVEDNETTIYARLKDAVGNTGGVATANITNIDKTAPEVITDLSAKATERVGEAELSIEVTDTLSGLSKIEWHYKTSGGKDNIVEKEFAEMNGANAGKTEKVVETKKIIGLTEGTVYECYAEVFDVAGKSTRNPKAGTVDVTIPLARWKNEATGAMYATMDEAFNEASSENTDTLTLLGSYTDSSAPNLTKKVIVNIGDNTLTKTNTTINIASGGKLILEGTDTSKITTSEAINLITVAEGRKFSLWIRHSYKFI